MKSTGQKNEIAVRTAQKLPRAASTGIASANSTSQPAREFASAGSGRKSDAGGLPGMMDVTTPSVSGNSRENLALDNGPDTEKSNPQIERIAQLVTQEVVMIKLSGATSLAVSLKVDPQTELFVQLTSHNGQIQASLRCERGDLAGLSSHWGQLQESLARQNVQLLPLEGRMFSSNPTGASFDATGSKQFQQSAQDKGQENHDLRAAPAPVAQPVKSASSRKVKNKTSNRQGWESWA
jgi:hypothetical protein